MQRTCFVNEVINNGIKKYKIYLSNPHSEAWTKLQIKTINLDKSEVILDDYDSFKKVVYEYLNNLSIYDRKECKSKIESLYNEQKYKFLLKKSTVINPINKWKELSLKFTKYHAIENPYDNDNNLFLRDHRIFYKESKNFNRPLELEYFIWANDMSISHMRKSENIFIDATFHIPYGFQQNLIFMYKDIITGEKLPCFYALMNNKSYILYDSIFKSVINILTQNGLFKLHFKTITSDAEAALLKCIKDVFLELNNFICLYHFKKDIIEHARILGLMKKNYVNDTKKVIIMLSKLAIDYNGNINYAYNQLKEIEEKFPIYYNLINLYFRKNKLPFFISGELIYSNLPIDCRTNNSLENYNKVIKLSLGKKK